ncbi:MAG: type I-E CRISPR-associated protein Cas6/Cse3/CasE [Alphaproteobacteria bacterium]|nr:type I-E CRISPR-associated protein Cas6/Cse3/CasE [Alphaproteobacteria bacterium]
MSELYLSRARLQSRRGEALASVAPLLIPADPKQRPGHAHRILWLLFSDDPAARRDFLFRDEGEGTYLILSRRPPPDPHNLFDLDTKDFEPKLSPGDHLRFALRANPTRATKSPEASPKPGPNGRVRGKRVDVVMHALKSVTQTDWAAETGRAFERDRIARETVNQWLAKRGEGSGFKLVGEAEVSSYAQIPLERKRGRAAGFSQVDTSGVIEVTDPVAFLAQLETGFGSAKAFGCGLMLIRRA